MNERFLQEGVRTTRRATDAHRQIGELLFLLGVTPHTEGYAMLRDGARLIADGGRFRKLRMTEELYPLLGESFRKKRSYAEHAMRDAVRIAWQREDADRKALYFDDEAPSNAALLYQLAMQLDLSRRRNG